MENENTNLEDRKNKKKIGGCANLGFSETRCGTFDIHKQMYMQALCALQCPEIPDRQHDVTRSINNCKRQPTLAVNGLSHSLYRYIMLYINTLCFVIFSFLVCPV